MIENKGSSGRSMSLEVFEDLVCESVYRLARGPDSGFIDLSGSREFIKTLMDSPTESIRIDVGRVKIKVELEKNL